jgi:hypothetical protein
MNRLDDELAQATDTLLSSGKMPPLEGENAALQETIRELYAVINPKQMPSAAFQQKMTARLGAEWDRAYAPPTLRLLERPLVRLAALAAAVVLVLASLLVLVVPDAPDPLQGTAFGMDDGLAVIVLVGVAAVAGFVFWRRR